MFAGSIVALVTPMHDDGTVDDDALQSLINWHIEQGTNAIVAVGTTGESATLNVAEHIDTVDKMVRFANGRIPIIAGNGANCTRESIELTLGCAKVGAKACLCVTPYYNKPTQEGMFQHFKAIAECSPIPQLLYNVPGRTAVDLLPETVQRLASIDNIIGIKEATGDLQRLAQLKPLVPSDFILLSGDDATGLDFMLQGGHGVISVTANIAPAPMSQMCQLARTGDVDGAKKIDASLALLHQRLFLEANPIPVKYALHTMGKIGLGIRLPMTVLSSQYQPLVDEALKHAGIE